MKKMNKGKKKFWITVSISWLLIIMLAVNLSTGDWLGDFGRGAVGVIAFVIFIAAFVMRSKDASGYNEGEESNGIEGTERMENDK